MIKLWRIFLFITVGFFNQHVYSNDCDNLMIGKYKAIQISNNPEDNEAKALQESIFQNDDDIAIEILEIDGKLKSERFNEMVDWVQLTEGSFVDLVTKKHATECALQFEGIQILKIDLQSLSDDELNQLYEISTQLWGDDESEQKVAKMSKVEFAKLKYLAVEITGLLGVTTIFMTLPLEKLEE